MTASARLSPFGHAAEPRNQQPAATRSAYADEAAAGSARDGARGMERGSVWTKVITDVQELARHTPQLADLGGDCIEANAFYEPYLFFPSITSFGSGADLVFLLVYGSAPDHDTKADRLIGFFPLERKRAYHGVPIQYLALWSHKHCTVTSPLVRSGEATVCLTAFLDWLKTGPASCPVLEFGSLPADGLVYMHLVDLFRRRGTVTLQKAVSARALLKCRRDSDTYLREAISPRKRRDLDRQQRRLSERGKLEFRSLSQDGDLDAWLDGMLSLEASGWKGAEGTALASSESDRNFFVTAAREAFGRGQLSFLGLALDGRWIALRCSFLSPPGAFFFKPAYDESLARNGPGVLLELETIRDLHTRAGVEWMDSCTSPDNEVLNRLWLDRRVIMTLAVATGGGRGGELLLSAVPLLRWLRRRVERIRRPGIKVRVPDSAGHPHSPV